MTNDTPATATIYWSIPVHPMERARCILCGAELYRVQRPVCEFCEETLREG